MSIFCSVSTAVLQRCVSCEQVTLSAHNINNASQEFVLLAIGGFWAGTSLAP